MNNPYTLMIEVVCLQIKTLVSQPVDFATVQKLKDRALLLEYLLKSKIDYDN